MKKVYIIAGEASGDLHASNLMLAMLQQNENLDFRFWGGDHMKAVKGTLVKHISDLAFMGFVEVLMNLRTILGNINFCKKDIGSYKPDVLVLVDYPGFNLRIAKWAKSKGIKVVYYISPQVWAWKQNRVHTIKKVVDKMLVILPFEKDFYRKFNVDVTFVGHPLLDAIQRYTEDNNKVDIYKEYQLSDKPIVAILPGSRKQEIQKKLPIMLSSIGDFKEYQFVIAGAPAISKEYYADFIKNHPEVKVLFGATYDILSVAKGAIVTSGTATLETALFQVPEVVCYKSSNISYLIAKRLVKIHYICLVNLILNKEAVKELIQHECEPKTIAKELRMVLPGGEKHEQIKKDYHHLMDVLGKGGASENAAKEVLQLL